MMLKSIYEKAHELKLELMIDLKRVPKNDGEIDRFYAPTCLLEHSYRYDSVDRCYDALKYTKLETHCRDCPLRNEDICQKVIPVQTKKDVSSGKKFARLIQVDFTQYIRDSKVIKKTVTMSDWLNNMA